MKYSIKNISLEDITSMLNMQIQNDICSTISIEYINKFTKKHEYRSFRREQDRKHFVLINYKSKQPITYDCNPHILSISELKQHILDIVNQLNCIYLIFE